MSFVIEHVASDAGGEVALSGGELAARFGPKGVGIELLMGNRVSLERDENRHHLLPHEGEERR